jgi:sugar lactone lactonase YvrE
VADIAPFDQPSTQNPTPAFRTNSYPIIAVDESGHVYLAWSQRGVGLSGGARIMLSSSYFGYDWSLPQPVANVDENGSPFLGHQIMPSMSYAAGKLILVWYDQRHDVSGYNYGFNNWILDDVSIRHTMDVWAAVANTDRYPDLVWDYAQVSRYLYSVLRDESGNIVFRDGKPIVFPAQFNCVNYPLFKGGLLPFDGDYIDVAATPTFVIDRWKNWSFNTQPSNSPVFHVAWTDNRDVRPPLNGDWTQYTPPSSSQNSSFITPGRPECSSGGNAPGMRNQNIYTSRITWGIEAGSPTNNKPLNLSGGVARAFVVFVKNNTGDLRSFRLTITNQPTGGQASFLQFELLATLDVNIAPYSTISRPVFISSSDQYASVTINVDEIDASGNVIAAGLKSTILINGDSSSPSMLGTPETHNPNIVNPNIVNWYVNPNIVNPNIVNPNIVNPNIVNPNIVNPNIVNPNIVNPNIVNPNIVNPNIVNPNIVNHDVPNPNIVNPNIVNPNIVNPNIVNAALGDITITDVEWTVKNDGNAATSFTVKTLSKKSLPEGVYAQLLVYKVHYTPAVAGAELSAAKGISACELKQEPHHELILNVVNPNIVNPNIVNPNIVNPNIVNSSIENATFPVGPLEEVIVDLRVLDTGVSTSSSQSSPNLKSLSMNKPSIQAFSAQEFRDSLGFAVTSQAVNSVQVSQGIQTPPAAATMLVIGTASLPDGVVGTPYNATLNAYGGTGSYIWTLNSGELPPDLALGGGGLITGTPNPTTAGKTYYFIVRVDDSSGHFDTQRYSITINPPGVLQPLTITTISLPDGIKGHWYGATLEATGGKYPRKWSLAGGALPQGLSLDSGGVISGTPIATGSSTFTVKVTDAAGTPVTTPFTIKVVAATATNITISGTVYNGQGTKLSGVVMRGLPNTPVTNADGYYQDTVPEHWTGTVIPFFANVTFSPPSRTYTNISQSWLSENYNVPSGYTISGKVYYSKTLLDGIIVDLILGQDWNNPLKTTTSANGGAYSFSSVAPGSYNVKVNGPTPEYIGWTASSVQVVNANVTRNMDLPKFIYLQTPTDGATVYTQHPTLTWTVNPEASKYTVQINKTQNWEPAVEQTPVSTNSYIVQTALDYGINYSWQVDADDANNHHVGTTKVIFKFTPALAAPASKLVFTQNPNGGIGGAPWTVQPKVEVQDATGKIIATDNSTQVTLAIKNNPGNGSLSGTASLQVSAGVASFSGLSINKGGYNYTLEATSSGLASATSELFSIEGFSSRANMSIARWFHTATYLFTDKILIAGGENPTNGFLNTAELYDPATNVFEALTMKNLRGEHTATSLLDGRVLITGGGGGTSTAELFDPTSKTFSLTTGTMNNPRLDHRATRLQDGRVLITGGVGTSGNTAELYDPTLGTFSPTGSLSENRYWHTSTWLPNGKVLITGGKPFGGAPSATAELYDPNTGTFSSIGSMHSARNSHVATLLNNGTVLITGGNNGASNLDSAEIFNPADNSFAQISSMKYVHAAHQALLLRDGTVLIFGAGQAEIYDPATLSFRLTGEFAKGGGEGVRQDCAAAETADGLVFASGGGPNNSGLPVATTEMWNPLVPFPTHVISGHVTQSGAGVSGVLMGGLPGYPVTDPAGYYEGVVLSGLSGWSGMVTPTKAGFTFSPPSNFYTFLTNDLPGQDYTAAPAPLPDLIVDSMTHSPANPTTTDLITFTAVVKNIGAGSAGASTLMFTIGGETPGAAGTLFSVPALASGASSTVTRQATLIAQNYRNTATADYPNAVTESNETNNTSIHDYYVVESYEFVLKWGTQGSGDSQFNYPAGIAVDSSGNVYVADTDNYRIQKFSADGTFVTKWGSYGTGDGQFVPYGIAVDSSGYVYVADMNNNRIQKFSSTDGINYTFVTKWGSYGAGDGQFYYPKGIAVDSSGYVYVADTWNHRIQKFSSTDGINYTFVTKWGTQGNGDGQFYYPAGIAVDSSGNVYVLDTENNRIQKFSADGTFVTKWGSSGDGDGQLGYPSGIVVDSSGYVYVADYGSSRIQKFSANGTFVTKWGSYGAGDGQFKTPYGIAVDSSGYVYVTDYGNHRIQKFRKR